MLHRTMKQETIMTMQSRPSRIRSIFDALGSAIAVSEALDGRRQPKARDLQQLGIEPATFRQIKL
jgi:hypothetical protein